MSILPPVEPGPYPPCFLCRDPSAFFATPDGLLPVLPEQIPPGTIPPELEGFPLTCENAQYVADNGLVEPALCDLVFFNSVLIDDICGCTGGPAPPSNDQCVNAIPLGSIPANVSGTTVDATFENVTPCGSNGAGVWYSFIGDGSTISTSTCDNRGFDTVISVFTGDCFSLTCLEVNDDFCGLGSLVSVLTEPGTEYFVLVSSFSSDEFGTFELSLEATTSSPTPVPTPAPPAPPNDECQNAIEVGSLPATEFGTTIGATLDFAPCFSFGGSGVWYSVTGSGNVITASTCGLNTNFITLLSVYTGGCDSLVCETSDETFCGFGSIVSWDAAAGTEYLILVDGIDSFESGSFELQVVEGTFSPSPTATPTPAPTPSFDLPLDRVANLGQPIEAFPLARCQGDCESFSDCAGDLICFERGNENPVNDVPGCSGTPGSAFTDFCIDTAFLEPSTLVSLGSDGHPESVFPLQKCQGNCRFNDDCAGTLACYQRMFGQTDPIPGCVGILAKDATNYCYDVTDDNVQSMFGVDVTRFVNHVLQMIGGLL